MTAGLPERGRVARRRRGRGARRPARGLRRGRSRSGPRDLRRHRRRNSRGRLENPAAARSRRGRLNAFAGRPRELSRRRGPTVATPHPGEAGRLLGRSSRDVQSDRLAAARALAKAARCCVLLKGEASLTATPDGRVVVNPTGTPLLATAGSGDVLSGVIAALVAGGLAPEDAAAAAAWLHGAAGERLARTLGDAGLLAHEVADAIPRVRRGLRDRRHGTRERGTRDHEEPRGRRKAFARELAKNLSAATSST